MTRTILLLFIAGFAVALSSCNSQADGETEGTTWGVGAFDSNGERIYFTSTSERGTPITYSGGPSMGMMMMRGKMACASCHGTDARGGKHMMHMEIMDAPDIRWNALSGHHHHHHDEDDEHHGEEAEVHHGGAADDHDATYGFAQFRDAVENGRHPDGDKLSEDMPRWSMSDADLHDLMDYLKSLN